MDKKLFKAYVKLNDQIKALDEQKEEMRATIISTLAKEGIEKAETDFGTFTRAKKTSHAYTDAVKTLEEKVKMAKTKEQQQGKTIITVSEYLVFTAPRFND